MARKGADLDVDRRILELFAKPEAFYRAAEVRRLLGLSSDEFREAASSGSLVSVRSGKSWLNRWEDVAQLALDLRTPREVFHILRDAGRESAIPRMNRFHTIAVELPLYQIRLLHHLAVVRSAPRKSPINVSDVLEYQLAQVVLDELPEIEHALPGIAIAATYPRKRYARDVALQCIYCGTKVDGPGDICAACTGRNVP